MNEVGNPELALRIHLFNVRLKDLKRRLPKKVTFISPIKGVNGDMFIRVGVAKEFYRFSIPNDFNLTEADWTRVVTLITEKIS